MKTSVRLIALFAGLGTTAGIAVIIFGKSHIAGIIWAVTALVSFLVYDINKKQK